MPVYAGQQFQLKPEASFFGFVQRQPINVWWMSEDARPVHPSPSPAAGSLWQRARGKSRFVFSQDAPFPLRLRGSQRDVYSGQTYPSQPLLPGYPTTRPAVRPVPVPPVPTPHCFFSDSSATLTASGSWWATGPCSSSAAYTTRLRT